jgi:hypothetical protein
MAAEGRVLRLGPHSNSSRQRILGDASASENTWNLTKLLGVLMDAIPNFNSALSHQITQTPRQT